MSGRGGIGGLAAGGRGPSCGGGGASVAGVLESVL